MRPALAAPRRPALLGLVLLGALCTTAAKGQALDMLGGGSTPGAGTLVERDEVEAAARASFAEALVARADAAVAEGAREYTDFRVGPFVEQAQTRYERALSARLDELHGDGVLTLAEVVDALPRVRTSELDLFADVVEARSAGHAPPPRRDEHGGYWPYAGAMARYLLLERNDAGNWARLVAWIVGGLVIAGALSFVLGAVARRADDSEHRAFRRSVDAIRTPLLLSAATLGALLGLEAFWKPSAVAFWLRAGLGTLLALFAFWAGWNLCRPLSGWIASVARRATDAEIGNTGRLIVMRVLRLVLIVLLVLVVTKFVIGASLTGILAGLGVAGVVLWFLLQGLIENLAASFTLFGDRSIAVGDTVVYRGQWGTIEDIGFRTTRFRTFEGHLITIPNANLVGDALENVSRRPSIRRRFHLGIEYDTPPAKIREAIEIVERAIDSRAERLADGGGAHVVLENFGSSDLQLLVQYHAGTTDYWEAQALGDEINREILERFDEAGIGIPFPTQTTILRSDADDPVHVRPTGDGGGGDRGRDADGSRPDDEPAAPEPA